MNESILLVEDEKALRTTLSDRLRSEGYVVETASDGREGFDKASSHPFDLIIMDIMKRANEEHHQILDLCRQRDVSAACRLLRQHIRYAGESLKQALEQKRIAAQLDPGNGNRTKS